MSAIELARKELAVIDAEETAAIETYDKKGDPKTVEQHTIGDTVISTVDNEAKHAA